MVSGGRTPQSIGKARTQFQAATIAGVVAGAAIGNSIGNHSDRQDYEYRDDNSGVVRRCRTVVSNDDGYDNGSGYGAYIVTYRYAGQTYQAVTNQRPGRYIRVTVEVKPQDSNGYDGYQR